jgi:Uma2 family endonuclease
MSAIAKHAAWISPEEYLQGEQLAESRHEYVDGQVYAMAGTSANHDRIATNILAELRNRLRGSKCEPFSSDFKLHIPATAPKFAEYFYYPDVMVACDPTEDAELYRERPTVLFEVLSPSTTRVDRSEKATIYHQIPTLKTYVIVDQEKVSMTVMRKSATGWSREIIEDAKASLKLPEIGVEIPVAAIYERTKLV